MGAKFDSLTGQNDPDGRRGKAEAALRNLVSNLNPGRAGEDVLYLWQKLIEAKARTVCRKHFDECTAADIERIISAFQSSQ